MELDIKVSENEINDSIGAGIYEFVIEKNGKIQSLYIGESVYMLKRVGEHLHKFKRRPEYFGFTDEMMSHENITLRIRILEKWESSDYMKTSEIKYIKKRKPLTQSGNSDRMKRIDQKLLAVKQFIERK